MAELPSILYHYTDAAGLIGILTSKTLWASNLLHMNDSLEDLHGAKVIAEFLRTRATTRTGRERELLLELGESFSRHPGGRFTYAFSLSEKPDVLSQWRGYAPSGGYCIGFFRESIETICKKNGFELHKCEYEKDRQAQIIRNELTPLLDSFTNWELSHADGSHRKAQVALRTEWLRAHFKHVSFQEEAEWRIFGPVAATDSRSKWRPAGPYVRPFVELPYEVGTNPKGNLGPIAEIWIGPGLDYKRAQSAVTHLFIGNGMTHIDVQQSKSPYRF